jgi:hypothetical protein
VSILKKEKKSEMSNYRPISLLTSFSKIFEKVIFNRLHNHVHNNNILAPEQYGFRNNLSTESASYNLINNILEALNNKFTVGGILCDLTKAFDCVNHTILLSKLEFYGITGSAYNLIKSYLNDRYRRVLIKNTNSRNYLSDWVKVKLGVPQSSILDPLPFLFYINDLLGLINSFSKPTLFADDTSLIFTHPDITEFKEGINTVFEKLVKWFQINLLSLNLNKTYYMQFMSKNSDTDDINIRYKTIQINNVYCTNFLGLTLDSTLS